MLAKNAKPRYVHDCQKCVFLGTITYPGPLSGGNVLFRNVDLYCCETESDVFGNTIIARESSKGSDYASAPVKIIQDHYLKMSHQNHFSTSGPALIAGYYFAKTKGLLK